MSRWKGAFRALWAKFRPKNGQAAGGRGWRVMLRNIATMIALGLYSDLSHWAAHDTQEYAAPTSWRAFNTELEIQRTVILEDGSIVSFGDTTEARVEYGID